MTRRELHRAVARATGESTQEIARRGFQPLRLKPVEEPEDYIIDWDELQLRRNVAIVDQRQPVCA